MASNAMHCPFLNRADARCSESFSLDNLDRALNLCFGKYTACPVYLELLVERRMKRSAARTNHGSSDRIIQVTVSRSAQQQQQNAQAVPALSGVGAGAGR